MEPSLGKQGITPVKRLFLLAKPPFKVLFSLLVFFFFGCFRLRSQFFSQLPEFLLCDRQTAAFADMVFGGYDVMHFSAAFWTINHYSFTWQNKHKS
jgi:hypothetical protein